MSNAYVNTILYGHSNRKVTKEYVDGLLPNMLTMEWLSLQQNNRNMIGVTNELKPNLRGPESHSVKDVISKELDKVQDSASHSAKQDTHKKREPTRKSSSLFWAIFESENPKEAFLRPSARNVEIETRMQIVDQLKKTPKRLKDTSAKLTMEQTQALFGSMLVAKDDRLDFCVAYSVYYNKHILIVYPKTYRLFSPTQDSTIEDDDHVIILYASSQNGSAPTYSIQPESDIDPSSLKSTADDIMRTRTPPLRAQSTYKTPELESIANKMDISTKTADGKRRKKEDIYNDIRVAIHNDMEFLVKQDWSKN